MVPTVLSVSSTVFLFFSHGFGLNESTGQRADEEKSPAEIIPKIRSLLNQTIAEYQNQTTKK